MMGQQKLGALKKCIIFEINFVKWWANKNWAYWKSVSYLKSILWLIVKFGFSEKATKFEKISVVLLTRASCSVRATAYLSKSWRRFFKTNVVKSYYTNFNHIKKFKNWVTKKYLTITFPRTLSFVCLFPWTTYLPSAL